MVIIETADRLENVIRPSEVRLSEHGWTVRSFGKHEVEQTAGRLVQYLRLRDYWSTFRLTELFAYYQAQGWDPNVMLFGLAGRWYDDGAIMIPWPSANYLCTASNGDICVTKEFVDACGRSVA